MRPLRDGEALFIKGWLRTYIDGGQYDSAKRLYRILERGGVLPEEEAEYLSLCPF
jgi:hypothetical protein